jgi:hypothetical protein
VFNDGGKWASTIYFTVPVKNMFYENCNSVLLYFLFKLSHFLVVSHKTFSIKWYFLSFHASMKNRMGCTNSVPVLWRRGVAVALSVIRLVKQS